MPAGTGSVCKRITIEPAPAAPAAETPMPRPTARTDRKSLTQPQLAQRRETKPSAGSVVATCEPKAPCERLRVGRVLPGREAEGVHVQDGNGTACGSVRSGDVVLLPRV